MNTAIQTALFSCFSFCFWLSDFQAEYIGADIYVLFYAQGLIAIISGQLVLIYYAELGMKKLTLWAIGLTIVSAIFIILLQQKIIGF